jgi:hypothetical protein
MTNLEKTLIAIIALIVIVGVGIKFTSDETPAAPLGNISPNEAMQGTSTYPTSSFLASTIISNSGGTLGSLIIASTTNATFEMWDATSTTDIASTSIAKFPASVAAGAYPYNRILTRGLIVHMQAGFAGSYTITSRGQ